MSESMDSLFPNTVGSGAALSIEILKRLKALPTFKMSLTEQLLIILLDAMNTRIAVLELSRERVEIENRRIKQLFYFIGVWTSLLTAVMTFFGISGITLGP